MVNLEDLAEAALSGDALALRGLTQDWLAQNPTFGACPRPRTQDAALLAVAASLVELFAARAGQPTPAWSSEIGPLETPLFLVRAAATMPRLRQTCENESPEPLRRRNLFVPANFLQFV